MKTQVLKIDSFTKKIEFSVRASTILVKDMNYTFSQLCQLIEHLENLENWRSGRKDESSLGDPHWM